ncbi:hypothetical protein Taro_009030 [Colocasia esculenta]|uniref:Uncharacterized protein n=1 Tax=Colocasia esculenta TaxID=4460 RepID=A0A843U8U2_COLES|nr:hypothetical protein [Colocasia esculenta]
MFPDLQPLFEVQGWSPFCYSHKRYSPAAVTDFYNNLRITTTGDLYTKVKDKSFQLTPTLLSRAHHIPNSSIDIMHHDPLASEYYPLITLQPYDSSKDRVQLIWLRVVGVVFLLVKVSRGEMSLGVRIRGLVQAMQTQAHTQAALQAQLEAQAQVPAP